MQLVGIQIYNKTACCTDTFGNVVLTSQCHCPVDKIYLKQRRENNTSVMFINLVQFLNANGQLRNKPELIKLTTTVDPLPFQQSLT